MKASTIRREIDRTQKELHTLKIELPNFERLFSENQAAEAKAKAAQLAGDATLETLSAARSRLLVSREMLDQHKSDIAELEAKISDLQTRYEKQSAGERLAVAKEHHETLTREYRDSVRHTLDTVEEALRAQLEKQQQVEARRQEITDLGLQLGIFQRSKQPFSRHPVVGTNFSRLYPAALPDLFDETFPELRADGQVLELLDQISRVDETVQAKETRQVLAHREAIRRAQLQEQGRRAQEAALAAAE